MDTASLARQLAELRDIEAIKQLVAEYCDIADDDHNQDRAVTIYAEDGMWEGGDVRAQGHEEIRALYGEFAKQISFSQHNVFNPRIQVDGSKARGTWNLLGPFTYRETGQRVWMVARSEDEYVKVNGAWKFQHHRGFGMEVPYEEGWPGKTPDDVFANYAWRGRPRSGNS